MSERAEVIFPLIILADAHFSHDTPRNSCSIFRSRAALRLEDLALRPRLISDVALPKAGGSKRLRRASFRADMGNGMYTLLRLPAEMEELRENPAMIRSAAEELLRYESPMQYTARMRRKN